MRLRNWLLGVALASSATPLLAADRMVGIVPSDGIAMLVKQFSVPAGTTILGVMFQNNDPSTVFPEVLMVRNAHSSMSQGLVITSATSVGETVGGIVTVFWPGPFQTIGEEDYLVAVRIPAGPGKKGRGLGPAIGADDVATPNGSFIAWGPEGELVPLQVQLAISLVTGGNGSASKGNPIGPEMPDPLSFILATPNPPNPSARIEFGIERTANASIVVYDVLGRRVRHLLQATLSAGVYERLWDGRDDRGQRTAAGVYIVTLRAGERVATQRVVIVK